jgi:hypothetical protein
MIYENEDFQKRHKKCEIILVGKAKTSNSTGKVEDHMSETQKTWTCLKKYDWRLLIEN